MSDCECSDDGVQQVICERHARELMVDALRRYPLIADYGDQCFGCSRSEIREKHGTGAAVAYETWWNARFLLGEAM